MAQHSSDALIIGAGIIGLSLALELRTRGLSVSVLEKGEPGREASWAAAGMLSGHHDPHTPAALRPLAHSSATMYPGWVALIEELSGLPAGFSRQGALVVSDHPTKDSLTPQQLAELEPALVETAGFVSPLDEDSVDPRELMPALLIACRNSGAHVHHEHAVTRVEATTAHTHSGAFAAQVIINCAGAWSSRIAGIPALPIEPAKGQMLAVLPEHGSGIRHTIRNKHVYCVPRRDGRIAIGATVERVGFDKRVDPSAMQTLHQLAANLVPSLGQARITEAWAGLRPATPDDLPVLGTYTDLPGYFVASGHYRNGILLAPVTAQIIADLITTGASSHDFCAFSPLRFSLY